MKALNLSDLGNRRLVRYHCRPGKSHPRGDKRRTDILSHLLEKHPQPVCLRDIGNAVGLSSINTVWEHVRTLSEAGLVSRGKPHRGRR